MEKIYKVQMNSKGMPNFSTAIELVQCSECEWAADRTQVGETGYKCLYHRILKSEDGYCDCGERRA